MESDEPREDADSQATPPAESKPKVDLHTRFDCNGEPLKKPYIGRRGQPRTGKWIRRSQATEERQSGHGWALSGRWKNIFLEVYSQCGNVLASAEAAEISYSAVKKAAQDDQEFSEAMKQAKEQFFDMLEFELVRRVMDGDWKFVLDKTGKRVKLNNVKSENLLMFIIKRFMPQYRDNYQGEQLAETTKKLADAMTNFLEGGTPQVVEVSARQETDDEEIARLREQLAAAEARKLFSLASLMPPGEVADGDA